MFGLTPPYLPYIVEQPSLGGLSDEAQARCVWCGDKWYVMHHKDGVCHSCIQKGKPTLGQIANRKLLLVGAALLVLVALAIAILN